MLTRLSRIALCAAMVAFAGLAWGSTPMFHPKITVDFQYPVVVGSKTLPPGNYIFRQLLNKNNPPVFDVMDPQGNHITLTPAAISAVVPSSNSESFPPTAKNTQVILQKINGKYYLDKIWIQGRTRGWDFQIPDSVKSQSASMQQETLPGTYEEENESAATQNAEQQSTAQQNPSSMENNSASGMSTATQSGSAMNQNETAEQPNTSSGEYSSAANSTQSEQSPTPGVDQGSMSAVNNQQPGAATTMNSGMTQQNATSGEYAGSAASQQNSSMTTSNLGQPSSATGGATAAPGQLTSVTGCLQNGSAPNVYTIQSSNGTVNAVPAADLQSEMSRQVGHEVRLVGLNTGSMAAMGGSAVSSSTATTRTLEVNRIDVIALNCH